MLFLQPILLLLSLAPSAFAAPSSSSSGQLQDTLIAHTKTGRPLPRAIHGAAPAHRRRMDLYQERSRYSDVLVERNISGSPLPPVEREIESGGRAVVGQVKRRVTSSCKIKVSSGLPVAAASSLVAKSSSTVASPSKADTPTAASSSVNVQANIRPSSSAAASTTAPSSSAKPSVSSFSSYSPSSASPSTSSSAAAPAASTALSTSGTEGFRSSPLFTEKRTKGDLTYYAQGQTSCGSVYTDESYTAAVSHLLYDSWPGASVNTNRNPICGPFVSGRLSLDGSVLVKAAESVLVGGDNALNCIAGEMCHVPLTATLTYEGKSVQVQIVDRCEGCAIEDIDVTPTVFQALTGNMGLGRVKGGSGKFSWSFDQ